MDDALLGANRAVAENNGVEIGSDAKAHAFTVTAAFVRSQLIHCRLGRTNRTARAASRLDSLEAERRIVNEDPPGRPKAPQSCCARQSLPEIRSSACQRVQC